MIKRLILSTAIAGFLVTPLQAKTPLQVVTTLSTFASLVETVGGDSVKVAHVASPKFNPHFIEPRPSDVLKVKRADLFVHAGLDLEPWRGPLVDAAGNREVRPGGTAELDLSRGVRLLNVPDRTLTRAEGDIHLYGNPHYWLTPENAKTMASSVAEKLSTLAPEQSTQYKANLASFLTRLDAKTAEWQQQLAPHNDREILGYHDQWPYLMQFTGLRMEQFLEPKPGISPSPKHLAFLKQYIGEKQVGAIAQATYFPRRASDTLAGGSSVSVIMLCQNVGEVSEASDYIALLDYNVGQLVRGLGE